MKTSKKSAKDILQEFDELNGTASIVRKGEAKAFLLQAMKSAVEAVRVEEMSSEVASTEFGSGIRYGYGQAVAEQEEKEALFFNETA